jgi:hypothetical protein
MSQYHISFKFKGDRKYIQGPDIMDAVISLLKKDFIIEEIKNFKYASHKMLHTNATITIDHNQINDVYSLISFKYRGEHYFASILPDQSEVEESLPYDETPITAHCNITGNKISIQYTNLSQFTFSELIVSMNKYFLQNTFSQKGKWIVTKAEYIDLKSIFPPSDSIISLVLIKNINYKLTKSVVSVNDQSVGHLFFSLI